VSLPAEYFEQMYAASLDPWGFADRWYEERKRAVTLAALPDRRYATAYEPGCSIGALTLELASRCDLVLASDISERALGLAQARLAHKPHVRLERRSLPTEWPDGEFDLIVLSEILYYLGQADLALTVDRAARAVAPGGTLVAVHWRHPVVGYPQLGDAVQAALVSAATGLVRTVSHDEADFSLVLLVRPRADESCGRVSVAQRGGLC